MFTFFGILVIPLGVISIYFVIIQPIVIGTWSTLALIAALAMLIMIPFALDEVIAMGQFVYWSHCHGKPLIRTFRSEEHTSELQSLMRISYAVFCLKKKNETLSQT